MRDLCAISNGWRGDITRQLSASPYHAGHQCALALPENYDDDGFDDFDDDLCHCHHQGTVGYSCL